MSSDRRERAIERVEHILSAIAEIEEYLAGLDEDKFRLDLRTVRAVTLLIQNIGEAAKFLADGIEVRWPAIPWRDVKSMRDRIVHAYWDVDAHILWRVATREIAPLKAAMRAERDWLEAQ